MKLRTISIVEAEVSVRALVDRDLNGLPPSFGQPADYRPRLVGFYIDQTATLMVQQIFNDEATSTPPDVQAALASQMVESLRQQIARAVNG
ncbi:MAG TPA: hypothetical protein VEW47_07105 [Candidatus Dormibacteraeota bacterium]|nr:hypothetical protein [Candidatus Dormibacteraeota bacterium]